MKARSMYTVFTLLALLGLVVSGSFAGTAYANSGPDGGGRSLSASGATAPIAVGSRGPAIDTVPVPDGGFENGPPPASLWTERFTTVCTTWILDPTSIWGIPARTGTYAWWAGGYCGNPNNNQVFQVVTVPEAPDTILAFYTVFWRVDEDDDTQDTFKVIINRRAVLEIDMVRANDSYPDWVLQTVDLSQYAGQEVTLKFGGRSRRALTGNVLVDDISFTSAAAIAEALGK